jgi:uncharacterized membrane protein YecN with MAPEG domain
VQLGIVARLLQISLELYEDLLGLDWRWQSVDGAMTKAPLGGESIGEIPADRAKSWTKRPLLRKPGTYLMPEQLPPNAIDTDLDPVEDPQVLCFRYDYEDIPKGLIPRFIVKMHLYLSKSQTYWANGVVLVVGACKILVRSDRRVRWVEIFVHGPANERREALRIVREGLEWVHSLFEEIGPKPMVPVRIPNKPDAAIEYSQLIEFERAGLEEFPFEGVRCKVRELLTGIAPVAPIQKSEDRRSDLHIYAGDRANVQVINGNDNVTSGSHNRTAQGISHPIAAQPKPFWQPLIAPIAVSVVTALLLLMWMLGVEPKWIALFGLSLLAGGVVYLVNLQREIVARTWASSPQTFARLANSSTGPDLDGSNDTW